jgi:chromosome segregation ATPase
MLKEAIKTYKTDLATQKQNLHTANSTINLLNQDKQDLITRLELSRNAKKDLYAQIREMKEELVSHEKEINEQKVTINQLDQEKEN